MIWVTLLCGLAFAAGKSDTDLGWFFKRYGAGTNYETAKLKLESFNLDEYSNLVTIGEQNAYIALGVLGRTLIPHLKKHPEDPKYAALKRRMQSKAFGKAIGDVDVESFAVLFSESFLSENLDWAKELTAANPPLLKVMPSALKKDRAFLAPILNHWPQVYPFMDETLQNDRELATVVVGGGLRNVSFLPQSLRKDKALVLLAYEAHAKKWPVHYWDVEYLEASLFEDEAFLLRAAEATKGKTCIVWRRMTDESKKKFGAQMEKINPKCKESP